MTRTVKLRLTATEVKDAIRDYCINVTGVIDDKMTMADDIRFGDDGIEVEFTDNKS